MNRMLVLLREDVKNYWFVPVLMATFALLLYFLPTFLQSGKIAVGMCGDEVPDLGPQVDVREYSSEENAMEALRRGEIDCLYIDGTIYGSRSKESEMELLAALLSPDPEPGSGIRDIEVNSLPSGFTLLPFLLSFTVLLGGVIGALALVGDEMDKRILDAIMLTPLTYREYVLERASFVLASTLTVPVAILFLTDGFTGNVAGIVFLLILQSSFFTLLFLCITFSFPSIESAATIATSVIIPFSLLDGLSLSNPSIPSMASVLYRVMVLEESSPMDMVVLLVLVALLFVICASIVRKSFRKA